MPKKKTSFQCSACGWENPRWMGKCPECGAWNTMEEIMPAPEEAAPKQYKQRGGTGSAVRPLKDIDADSQVYTSSGLEELDRVLAEFLVPEKLCSLKAQAIAYGAGADFRRRSSCAADILEHGHA